ncbi:MAG TPA: ATP-dependent zinc metalloprotease FtsH [Candidatus Paceibacterota bacterium]|nr:ATP-dependent zinc metalloprotease FtsH [Candidatus Paceibacterota bacterium]
MRNILRAIGLVFVALIAISALAAVLGGGLSSPEELSLSELAARINDGAIAELSVQGDTITATDADGAEFRTTKEAGVSALESLERAGAQADALGAVDVAVREGEGFSAFLAGFLQAIIPFALVLGVFWYLMRQAQRGSMQAFNFGKSRAKLSAGATTADGKRITFADVAGLLEAKEEIAEVVQFLRDPDKFARLGARIPRGILLVGSPGTGKTLLAKAVANEADVPFFYVSGSEFVEMFVGVGANRVRDTFETAKRSSPSIIFVDEIDAVGRQRGAGLGGGHDEREQTLNQILVEMDGFEPHQAVIVVAATNRPDILDPALLRPGRFDRRIILDEPSRNDREAILKLHAADKPLAKDVNLRTVAERTPGLSGADLGNLMNEAAILAARRDRKTVTQQDILEAIEKVMLGPERRSHVMSAKEKEVTAFHEAGHALVAASVPHSDPVHKVSIIARGRAGGYTMKLPSEDKYLKTKSEFEAELAVLLGGYTAEQLVFKELTTGASNDLKQASELARRMVTRFGMSEKLGPVTYGHEHDSIFLGREMTYERNYSETMALRIDEEVTGLIVRAMKTARDALTRRMQKLHLIAHELIAKETLEQDEFNSLIGQAA